MSSDPRTGEATPEAYCKNCKQPIGPGYSKPNLTPEQVERYCKPWGFCQREQRASEASPDPYRTPAPKPAPIPDPLVPTEPVDLPEQRPNDPYPFGRGNFELEEQSANEELPRFFIDHGMIHDRVTGKHVTTNPDSPYEDGITKCCDLLNSLTLEGELRAAGVDIPAFLEKVHTRIAEVQRDEHTTTMPGIAPYETACDYCRALMGPRGCACPRPEPASPPFAAGDRVRLVKNGMWPGMPAGTLATVTGCDAETVRLNVDGWGGGFGTSVMNVEPCRERAPLGFVSEAERSASVELAYAAGVSDGEVSHADELIALRRVAAAARQWCGKVLDVRDALSDNARSLIDALNDLDAPASSRVDEPPLCSRCGARVPAVGLAAHSMFGCSDSGSEGGS